MERSRNISNQFSLKSTLVIVCLATLILFNVFTVVEGKRCSMFTEYTIVYPDHPNACRTCPTCPVGHGLPIQCGQKVSNGTSTDCIPCPTNTFSITNDTTACKPCHECDGKKVVKECTPTQNRECGTTCLDPNYYLDSGNDECKMCYFCCENATDDERIQQCKDIGLPIDRQCKKTPQNEQCKLHLLKSTTTTPAPETTTRVPEGHNHSSNLGSPKKPPPAPFHKNLDNNNKQSDPAPAAEDYRGFYIVGGVLCGVFLFVIAVNFRNRRNHSQEGNRKDSEQGDEHEMTVLVRGAEGAANASNGDEHDMTVPIQGAEGAANYSKVRRNIEAAPTLENHISEGDENEMTVLVQGAEGAANSSNVRRDIEAAPTLENHISEGVMLDDFLYYGEDFILKLDITSAGVKNWRQVACKFNVSTLDAQMIEQQERNNPSCSPTRALIAKLCTRNVSLKKFVEVLQELDRNDVANDILKWYSRMQL